MAPFRPGFEPSSKYLELRSSSRSAVSWTCLTLLDSPDPAGIGVGRASVVFLRGALFPFLVKISTSLFVRTDACQPDKFHI